MKKFLSAMSLIALSTAAVAEVGGMPPYTLDPGPHAKNWEAIITGTGQSVDEFDRSNFGLTGSLGYYYSKNFLLTFKQGLQYGDTNKASLVNGRSVFQAAYQWDFARWQPYLGMNIGAVYGAGIHNDGVVGPEGGLKYFVNESTFIFGSIAYEVPVSKCCNNGSIPYSIGIGFDF